MALCAEDLVAREPWDKANLERVLNGSRPFSVVNLGFNNEGAYSFLPTLRDFKYLDYDVVILYEGYNDMPGDEGPNTSVFRHNSAVFRLTGYFPILPLYLDEKAMMFRYGGDLSAAYAAQRGDTPKTVFKPNLIDRTSATAIDTVAKAANSLGAQLGRLSKVDAPAYARVSRIGCSFPYIKVRQSHSSGPKRKCFSHHALDRICAEYTATAIANACAAPSCPNWPSPYPKKM